jgi:trehalose 6-phosphate synthase
LSRVVVVSNRVAIARKGAVAGGLAVALLAALRAQGGLWFGWSGMIKEYPGRRPRQFSSEGVDYATIDLSPHDYEVYYAGFANRTLWPLFHYRPDVAIFDRKYFDGYRRVNTVFARRLQPLLQPDDIVWVHDYHLIGLGAELRQLGCNNPIGFFLHTPFPAAETFLALPRHRDLVQSLFAYDLLGMQTENDERALTDYVVHEAGGTASTGGKLNAFGETTRIGTYPIAIDLQEVAELTASPPARREYTRTKNSLEGRAMIIGVDRLDYTKGLLERFQAFENLLEAHPECRNRVHLTQIAPPSRSDIPAYADMRAALDAASGHINGRFSDVDWVPIRYMNKAYSRSSLMGILRASQIGLVTPFRDGMNLVAKEYVAAQNEDDPGVLILSRFAGAARELESALIVNPYDVAEVASALHWGLGMSLEERRERHSAMIDVLKRNDLRVWCERFLGELAAPRRESRSA